jgi:hypothetical protein
VLRAAVLLRMAHCVCRSKSTFLGLINPEDGGGKINRNVVKYTPKHITFPDTSIVYCSFILLNIVTFLLDVLQLFIHSSTCEVLPAFVATYLPVSNNSRISDKQAIYFFKIYTNNPE